MVCAWLGNTPTVAHKHYLTVTDEHFAAAAKTGDQLGTQTPVSCRGDSQKKTRTIHKVRENASSRKVVAILEDSPVAEEGLEPPTRGIMMQRVRGKIPEKNALSHSAPALATAVVICNERLQRLVRVWGFLSDGTQDQIMRLVDADLEASKQRVLKRSLRGEDSTAEGVPGR